MTDVTKHAKVHSEALMYSCATCQKTLRRKIELKIHMITHSTSNPHTCTVCKKAFAHESYLKRHNDRVHLHIKKYECKLCGKRFAQSGGLSVHVRTHTEEKPFIWDFCQNFCCAWQS